MQSKWRLSHVQGYLGLGLVAEAAAEFAHLSPTERDTTPALALRVAIFQAQQNWPALRDASIAMRRKVHKAFLKAGLAVDGASPAHEAIVYRYIAR